MIKNIIFDCSGVITDEDPVLTSKHLARIWKIDQKKIWRNIFIKNYLLARDGKLSAREYHAKCMKELKVKMPYDEFAKLYLSNSLVRKPMLDLVKKLKGHYRLFLLSNQTEINTIYLHPILDRHFEKLFFSNEEGLHKYEDIGFYKLVLKQGVNPRECVFIDNYPGNFPPARKLGIKTIHFRNLPQLKKDLIPFIRPTATL